MSSSHPFKTAEFKRLAAKWNKILIEEGHEEIEDFSLPDPALLKWDNLIFKNVNLDDFKAKQAYYEKARALIYTYPFKNPIHKRIWAMHSEGETVRDIASKISRKRYKKSTVFKIVKAIQKDIK